MSTINADTLNFRDAISNVMRRGRLDHPGAPFCFAPLTTHDNQTESASRFDEGVWTFILVDNIDEA